MSQDNFHNDEKSVLDILQEINSGLLDPRLLDVPTRRRCVEFLTAEGYTHAQIAQILKCSEKTVFRDLKEIRAGNALTPNTESARQFIGDVFKKAMTHHDFLVRHARNKDTPAAVKVESEFAAWKILKELIEKMQSLGYLPSIPQQIVGDVFHHHSVADGNDDSLNEAKEMIVEIESVAKETNTFTPELENDMKALRKRIENAEIISEAQELKEKQKEESNKQAEDYET